MSSAFPRALRVGRKNIHMLARALKERLPNFTLPFALCFGHAVLGAVICNKNPRASLRRQRFGIGSDSTGNNASGAKGPFRKKKYTTASIPAVFIKTRRAQKQFQSGKPTLSAYAGNEASRSAFQGAVMHFPRPPPVHRPQSASAVVPFPPSAIPWFCPASPSSCRIFSSHP